MGPDDSTDSSERERASAAQAELLDLIWSGWKTQAIHAAATLDIPDLLAAGARTSTQVARALDADATAVHRLMRALASLGICTHESDDSFVLTERGMLLRRNVQPSLREWAIWWGAHLWSPWGDLAQSVVTGKSARARSTGQTGYAHIAQDPAVAATFNAAMREFTQLVADDVAHVLDCDGAKLVVDVGSGYGELLAALLLANSALEGVAFDLAHAQEGAIARMEESGLSDRTRFVTGDFFADVAPEGDLYILKSVLHNWSDEQCKVILRNCRRAMADGGRVAIVERILPARVQATADDEALARIDLHMLVGVGGHERTLPEFQKLLALSGLQVGTMHPLRFGFSLLEAVPMEVNVGDVV